MKLTSAPRMSPISLRESPLYQAMGRGLTDSIMLVGHGDGLSINDPHLVRSVTDTLKLLNYDSQSPLVLGLMQAYYAGAKDIWLMATAPMSEYEPDLEDRDEAYYQTYYNRLETGLHLLQEWDAADFIVPLEAPLNSTSDFLGLLAYHCARIYYDHKIVRLGFLGTRGPLTQELAEALVEDSRLGAFGEVGKFISVFAGDATFNFKGLPYVNAASVVTTAAAQLSNSPLDRGLTFAKVKNAITPTYPDLSKETLNTLAEAGINPIARNALGTRGQNFNTIFITDNTLAREGSDFWSLAQMRLASTVTSYIKRIGKQKIGTIQFPLFKTEVENYLRFLTTRDLIRDYELNIYQDPRERTRIYVDLVMRSYAGLREIAVDVSVGPIQ